MADDPVADVRAVFDVFETGLVWHCMCAVTRLDVPDRLAGGPLAVPQLAAAVGAHEDSLRRVLRLLSDHGIVTLEKDQVGLTGVGRVLSRAHPLSQHATFATVSVQDVAHALTGTLRTGQAATLTALGAPYWEYLAAHPDQQALFGEQMRQQAQISSLPCVPLVDWPAATVADIAGGIGTVLAAVLRAAPHAHGILVDEPQVLQRAGSFLDSQGVAGRCAPFTRETCSPRHPRPTCTCLPGCCTTGTTTTRSGYLPRWALLTARGCGSSKGCSLTTTDRTGPRAATWRCCCCSAAAASAPPGSTGSYWTGQAGRWARL